MSTKILFVFEGARSEDVIVNSLERTFLNGSISVNCVYAGEIYQLYKEVRLDPDLDLYSLIKDRSNNREILKDFSRDSFAEIYLFFDYDGHAPLASRLDDSGQEVAPGDEKIGEMLNFFNNETDQGKLYLSYPMVEAIRHIEEIDSFSRLTAKCKGQNCEYMHDCDDSEDCLQEPHYKAIVGQRALNCFNNIHRFTWDNWVQVISMHLMKMTYIVSGNYIYPDRMYSQPEIFSSQMEKFICKRCPEVSVLSAFPVFLHDYYGNTSLKEMLNFHQE